MRNHIYSFRSKIQWDHIQALYPNPWLTPSQESPLGPYLWAIRQWLACISPRQSETDLFWLLIFPILHGVINVTDYSLNRVGCCKVEWQK